MECYIGLSKETLEEFIVNRMYERLKSIFWGKNCETLREAMTFSHEWLLAGVEDPNERKTIADFLFKERFVPKTRDYIGSPNTSWLFPNETKNGNFLRVKRDFEYSQKRFLEEMDVRAKSIILSFDDSSDFSRIVHLDSLLFKKNILERLAEYNQNLMIIRNRDSRERREFINYTVVGAGNVLVMYKCQDSKRHFFDFRFDDLEKIKQNAGGYNFYTVSNKCIKFFDCAIRTFIGIIPKKRNKLLKYFVEIEYLQDFKNFLDTYGIKVSFLPKYNESQYTNIGTEFGNVLPVYIDVSNFEPVKGNQFNSIVEQKYRQFCMMFK